MSQNNQQKYIANTLNNALTNKYLLSTIIGMRYTFKQFKAEYPDDEACLRAVLENRFGTTCPKCGVVDTKFYPITGRKAFACLHCRKHVYPLADTIFRKSETSLWNWFYAIYLFSVAKNGVSAKELERHLGVTYKTAWRMAKQIRILMQQDGQILTGTVEMDETYIGGRKKGKSGRGADGKTPVFGMVERYGTVKALVTSELSHNVIHPLMRNYVKSDAIINTDSFHLYKSLSKIGYNHSTVNHTRKEYVRGDVHTNTIEGFWGQMKRSIDGTYHSVSPKYLQSYVNEFVFRYNFRELAICPLLLERAWTLS